ncbi:MAG: AzlC family ABC transporter permease [Azospirillaceae bacterium]
MIEQVLPRADDGSWLSGLAKSTPILLGYLPVGFAFGILALETGLSPVNTIAMSALVLGAASQLVAIGQLAVGMPAPTIIATTFIVNLRHMLMASALAPYLRGWPRWRIAVFAYGLTDEAFALHAERVTRGPLMPPEAVTINLMAHGSWVAGTVLGVVAGRLVADIEGLGIDYALAAMFIALLVLQIRSLLLLAVAGASAAIAVGLALAGIDYWNVVIATLIAATAGVGIRSWISTRSS